MAFISIMLCNLFKVYYDIKMNYPLENVCCKGSRVWMFLEDQAAVWVFFGEQ